jgi:two-component system NarL family sensor kinase
MTTTGTAVTGQSRRRRATTTALSMVLVNGFCLVGAAVTAIRVRDAGVAEIGSWELLDVSDLLVNASLAVVGALIVVRGSAPRYGWLMLGTATVAAVTRFAGEIALLGWYVTDSRDTATVTAMIWLQDLSLVVLTSLVLLLPSLFPDGYAVDRWRRPVRVASIGWAVWVAVFAFSARPAEVVFLDRPDAPDNPAGLLPVPLGVLQVTWLLLMIVSAGISLLSLRTRWRSADVDQRQQLKWVLLALGVAAFVLLLSMLEILLVEVAGIDVGLGWVQAVLVPLSWIGVVVALGLGVLRYRLYDVDLVINRALVYGVLTALVIAAYTLLVAAGAALVPGASGTSLLAAGVVAVAFAPARARVQGAVDRAMFGRRSDPVGVLADVGTAVSDAGSPDATVRAVTATIAAALKVPGAAIETGSDREPVVRVGTGELGEDPQPVPLRHHGELVGRLLVAHRSHRERLSAQDLRLLDTVAPLAAASVSAVTLNERLQRSREELVLAREEERRRLRRDLHDGLGPSLAAQTFRLDAALAAVDHDPQTTVDQLRALKEHNRELVAEIRRLVHDLRPPALDELGLTAALATHVAQLTSAQAPVIDVHTRPDPLGSLPAAVEVAAYRIATEALTNTVRHARATHCAVELCRDPQTLTVRVVDDGVGISTGERLGVGQASMRERAAELGGSLTVQPTGAEGGTVVTAVLPLSPADLVTSGAHG